jgi:hypothetical protein
MGRIEQYFLIGSFLPSMLFYYFNMKNDAVFAFFGAFIALTLWAYAPKIRENRIIMTFLTKYF